jgi:SAM-dependent methyltransferase
VKPRLLRLLRRLRLLRLVWATRERVQALRPGGPGAAPDGLPVPSSRLRVLVAGTADLDWFLESGALAERSIRAAADRHGVAIDEVGSMLDFGCGCGRVTRRWQALGGVHGTDTNPEAVAWCRRNLPFGRFETNELAPPLAFAAESFDLVYGLSVLTHHTTDLQRAWRAELRRVLRPGGLLLLTTHGGAYRERLTPPERERFDDGVVVVRWSEAQGSNLCAAYHPPGSLERLLPLGLAFLELEPEGALGNPRQDVNVIRKQ